MVEKPPKDTFGENLKREREMRGVTLQEISTATRIAIRFLQAIENEQWDQLPGGVFNRGFVRAIARYLGLDEESVVAEYGLAIGDRSNVPVWTGSPPAVTPQMPWLAWVLTATVAIVLILGGWFAVRRVVSWRAARRAGQSAATSVQTSEPPAVLEQTTQSAPISAAQTTSPDQTAAPDSSAPESSLELKLEASEATNVTVESDTRRVFNGTMKAGETRNFTAQDKFQVSATDAGALLVQFDGQTQSPLGRPGEAGSMTLTRDALKATTGGLH
jgi:cytoskeleton protein RodZ